jgi:hypothetical protein
MVADQPVEFMVTRVKTIHVSFGILNTQEPPLDSPKQSPSSLLSYFLSLMQHSKYPN